VHFDVVYCLWEKATGELYREGRKAEKDPEHMAASCSLLGCY